MDLFQQQWATYRAVLDHDLMEHEAMSAACGQQLRQCCTEAEAPSLGDLGCGDLALLAPLLRELPLADYAGLDLCAEVLPLAQAALKGAPYPQRWIAGDLLGWALRSQWDPRGCHPQQLCGAPPPRRREGAVARRLPTAHGPGRVLDLDRCLREAGESRANYLARYETRVESWSDLTPPQRRAVLGHIQRFDHPAERGAIESVAAAAGWSWQWVWQGCHKAEAMAVLRPA